VLAVSETYRSLFSGFTWELFAFETEFNAFDISAVAYFAELVLPCHAANTAVGA
jgi:hypothetical protein